MLQDISISPTYERGREGKRERERERERTICFETSFHHAAERKELKYEDMMARARSAGYSGRLITLQVGSRGIVDQAGFEHLKHELNIGKRVLTQFLTRVSYLVIQESYKIWCRRNAKLT